MSAKIKPKAQHYINYHRHIPFIIRTIYGRYQQQRNKFNIGVACETICIAYCRNHPRVDVGELFKGLTYLIAEAYQLEYPEAEYHYDIGVDCIPNDRVNQTLMRAIMIAERRK